MPRQVQCLVCRHLLSAHSDKQLYAELDIRYAYCERCYRERVAELESTIAEYKACVQKHKQALTQNLLNDHLRQIEFLSSGWTLGQGVGSYSAQANVCRDNISSFQNNVMFSDVILVPGYGSPVPAHRVVLAGRSPVFRAMFCSSPMKEAMSGIVLIDDFNEEVLAAFVGFFYTATVAPEALQKHAIELLGAAEKYNVELLHVLCENAIANTIDQHNAISILEVARKFGSHILQAAVLEFVSKDVEQLSSFEEYQIYATKNPGLLLYLYEHLTQKNYWPTFSCSSGHLFKRKRLILAKDDQGREQEK
ncbi:hypothetical protein KP509_03G075700 [Ceratopteris richardii]|uniref:BTB domain-containing protein n=1 Tax=Ceratopteris richardii TaxID=49495 RepID=A0A8T2V578_CERRI|nr:hypothetical protein KP509_03G075700 [Ceratopteris richardii]KAH7442184.1 hypothetical protein KP509_03G075700 [Ceratopteris richardii]KAH7442185.1 hypothetical protein KP509_03G075700 [Ceratopteris richardii]KAH7442186.1 hypothetical protein KP509_03G075700 [Ceratopteris richardii]KAH7442187.1 hypothetical protein KP509_03G075700 [Ceratopteris richardii]